MTAINLKTDGIRETTATTRPSRQRLARQRVSRSAAGSVLAAIALIAWLAPERLVAIDSPAPRVIAGGPFEASGVAHVPGTNHMLFVDDGNPREIFLMELMADGSQKGAAVAVPLAADVTDIEGITSDGHSFYLVGSQSKGAGFEGDGLVRFTFDPQTRLAGHVERIQGLKEWLSTNVAELGGTARRIGDEVLNVEGIAWDPHGERLLLGLRAPVVNGEALVIPIKLRNAKAAFSRDNLRVDGPAMRLPLGGAGIRSIEYDERVKLFRIITGAGLNRENRDFRILEWDGTPQSHPREIATFPRNLKPEGITRATIDGRSASVIVFDTGRFTVLD